MPTIEVLWAGARRFALIFAGVLLGTGIPALLIALAAGIDLRRALSVTYYCVGAALLAGTVVTGIRGPFRADYKTEPGPLGRLTAPRTIRKATIEERMEGHRLAVFLFAVGILVLIVGAALDPVHNNF
jgi:hypothetical protein